MNWLNNLGLVIFLGFPAIVLAHDPLFSEKQKNITLHYELPKGHVVSVENQFGDIKVVYWNKEVAQVHARITASGVTDEKANALLQHVQIQHQKLDNQIQFKTRFTKTPTPPEKGFRSSLRVDYILQIPRDAELELINSFGDIYMPDHAGKLTIRQKYGKLYANHLSGSETDVQVSFGQVLIKSMQGGHMKAAYSQVVLDEVTRSELTNSFGDLHVKIARDVRGVVSYSSGLIDQIKEASAWQVNYAPKFRINQVDKRTKEIKIQSAYSPVEIPNGHYDFEVRLQNGQFSYQGAEQVILERQPKTQPNQPIRVYMGKVGSDLKGDTKIYIMSKHGQVKIQP